MDDLFKELQELGIKDLGDVELFKKKESKAKQPHTKSVDSMNKLDYVYQKKMKCPVCSKEFMTSLVRTSKLRFKDSEMDLRPVYIGFDPLPYDVLVCTSCGYASSSKTFLSISDAKAKKVKINIGDAYSGKSYSLIYDYPTALERYKLALLTAMVSDQSNGVKAYLCLKISWLYRAYKEELEGDRIKRIEENQSVDDLVKKISEVALQEQVFSEKAYEGFKIAYSNENSSNFGFDEATLEYLLGELARRSGDLAEAKRWISRCIGHKDLSKRLKEKIYDLKELMLQELKAKKVND